MKPLVLLVLTLLSMNSILAQCGHQVFHTSGSETVNGIEITVTSSGHVGTITNFCVNNTQPYLIGADYTFPNLDGSYTFEFSPAIDSLTLNFGGIHNNVDHQEIIKIFVNANHYSIPSEGIPNDCGPSLAVLTPAGNITGVSDGSTSGWNGTTILGPISQITVLDSVAFGVPGGSVFSLFICSEFVSSNSDIKSPELLVYPIPANEQITIKGLSTKNIDIKLFDQLGRSHFINPIIKEDETVIDVSNLSIGIYYLSINNGENLMSKKVIINRK